MLRVIRLVESTPSIAAPHTAEQPVATDERKPGPPELPPCANRHEGAEAQRTPSAEPATDQQEPTALLPSAEQTRLTLAEDAGDTDA